MVTFKKLSEIPSIYFNCFTTFYMGEERYYQVFRDVDSFTIFYKNIPIRKRHYYEVIRKKNRKLILDIDVNISMEQLLDLKSKIIDLLDCEDPIIFSSCDKVKTSYHVVVPNKQFTVDECKDIISVLDPNGCILDRSVYSKNQLFRIEGSTKFLQSRYKYVLGKHTISDDLSVGLAYIDRPEYFPFSNTLKSTVKYETYKLDDVFKVRKRISSNLVSLTRTRPSYCTLCNRVHDHENAYLVKIGNEWEFRCFRYDHSNKIQKNTSYIFPIMLV